MKRYLAFMLALFVAFSLALAGCGASSANQAAQQSSPAVSTTASTAAETTAAPAPVKLSITWWGSQTRHDYTAKLLDMYTKLHPNVTFDATPAGWDGYSDKLAAEAAGNVMPDIVQMDYSFITQFTKNNTLADMTPYVNDNTLDLSDVDPNMVGSGRIGGKLTGIVLSSTALAISYNPDVFSKAGVAAPTPSWTWSDFEKDMTTIAQKEKVYGIDKIEAQNIFAYWCVQHGQKLYSDDGTKLGYSDDQIFIDYVNMIKRLTDAKALPTPDEWAQISSKGKEAEPVVTGEGGSTLDWANYAVIVSGSNPNLKLVPPPYGDNGTKALFIKPGMFFSVAQSSKNQVEAAKFISWFINDIDANKVIMAERGIPVASKVREALKPLMTQQQKDMFDYIDVAIKNSVAPYPPDPAGATEVITAFNNEVNMVLYGKTTPKQAAADFRKQANEILARNSAQ